MLPLLFLTISGCTYGKPFEYDDFNEIPEGRGVFSGRKGVFILYSSPSQTEHDALRAINRGLRPHPPGAVTAPGPPQLFFYKPLKNQRNFVFPIHEHRSQPDDPNGATGVLEE